MARAATAPANEQRLRWARDHAGLTLVEAARRVNVAPDRLESWETGNSQPTINQLRNLAQAYRQTVASFLLPGPGPVADQSLEPADFRSSGLIESDTIPALRREIDRALDRRQALIDLQIEPAGNFPSIPSVFDDVEAAAATFCSVVGEIATTRFKDAREALASWISRVEQMGVLVFQMSRVDPDGCRGISLWRDPFPIIILNGADEIEGRLFTLLHECGHLLARQSGICGVLTGPDIEARCNEFAGAVLIPADRLETSLGSQDPILAIARVANTFRVSQSAVAIRLRSLGKIDRESLSRQLAIAVRLSRAARDRAKEEAKKKNSGPPHHILKLRNLSAKYVGTVLDSLDSGTISLVDAAYFLESKVPTIDNMRSELLRRGAGSSFGALKDDDPAVNTA